MGARASNPSAWVDPSGDEPGPTKPPSSLYKTEFEHMQQLGLGRGINAASPDIWMYKTPWQVRTIIECKIDPEIYKYNQEIEWQQKEIERQDEEIEKQSAEIEKQKEEIEKQNKVINDPNAKDSEKEEAKAKKKWAEHMKEVAEAKKEEAEKRKKNAEEKKKEAEEKKKEAEEKKKEAEEKQKGAKREEKRVLKRLKERTPTAKPQAGELEEEQEEEQEEENRRQGEETEDEPEKEELVRNVISTNETGLATEYEKEVYSLTTQQTKLSLQLTEPTTNVAFGMDANNSQTQSSTVTIKGKNLVTRTITFQTDFNDLSSDFKVPPFPEPYQTEFSAWIMQEIKAYYDSYHKDFPPRDPDQPINPVINIDTFQPDPYDEKYNTGVPVDDLKFYSADVKLEYTTTIVVYQRIFQNYVTSIGITHYVSSIRLGAIEYEVTKVTEDTTSNGIGGNAGVGSTVKASASTSTSTTNRTSINEKKYIGKFQEDGTVKRNDGEAVIGFEIESISQMLAFAPLAATSCAIAANTYLQLNTDNTKGPYLISTEVGAHQIYWVVDQKTKTIKGTTDIRFSSIFYVVSVNVNAIDYFTIAYWGDKISDRKILTSADSQINSLRTDPPVVPRYLTAESPSICSTQPSPIRLSYTFDAMKSYFSVYDRVTSKYLCYRQYQKRSLQDWIDGGEYFMQHIAGGVEMYNMKSPKTINTKYLFSAGIKPKMDGGFCERGSLSRIHSYHYRQNAIGKPSPLPAAKVGSGGLQGAIERYEI